MNSSIYIDGAALWVLVIMAALVFTGLVILGCGYIAEAREIDRLKRENRRLKRLAGRLSDVSFKAGFETGMVLRGNGNVQM